MAARSFLAFIPLFTLLLGVAAPPDVAATVRPALSWRAIGPFRGGRTVAVSGVPGRPHEFYLGAVNGGVFKTIDAGRTWTPIFDDQPSASIGAIAVAPSAPDVVYVGSGEGRQRPDLAVGDGIYKSTDGGAHWTHLGLRDGQQIPKIVVDPHDPTRLFVAVLGHPYGANPERGLYRSTDGGAHFERVLGNGTDAGAFDVALDPHDSRIIYASLWAARQSPWETADGGSFERPDAGSGLYKSTDSGATWTRLAGGLPTARQGVGRVAVAVAPSDARRVYAFADASGDLGGVYRSGDGGATWTHTNDTSRVAERGADLATIAVDPRDPDTVYETNTSTYKSTDGGKTFVALRGAPGGDDYQAIWIAPDDPRTIVLGSDQGAIISVDGGASWSSWYNQPTAQFYHVITDDRVPYRVYGGQQESGSAGILSRGNDGAITFRDWHPVGVEEYGYAAPDPLHPGVIFGGKVTRYDERSGQTREVGPVINWRRGAYRFRRTAPLAFSPADKRTLYLGANVLFRSRDYGERWTIVSPDLTRTTPANPASLGIFAQTDAAKAPHRGVIYALGLSPRDANVLWAGTDDGLVWHSADGGNRWTNVTPPGLEPWAKVSIIDPSPFDAGSAYVAINRFRLDEQCPQLLRTHDGGKTWTEIDRGIDATPTNVVRADPQRPGLLYAGTERGVWVSFDDGDSWSSLRLNLPATSVRDLVVHGDDLVIGTHGRGFWILDDVRPLRAPETLAAAAPALLDPAPVWRMQRDTNTDTPLPPDEPFFVNAPDGAYLDYMLPRGATHVALTVADEHGSVLRRFSSDDPAVTVDPSALEVPAWWIAPPVRLPSDPGLHRFVWNLELAAPHGENADVPIAAIPHATPVEPEGVRVPPGRYTVMLDADGTRATRTLVVREDPRVDATTTQLQAQFTLAREIAAAADASYVAQQRVRPRDAALARELARANGGFVQLLRAVEGADAAPTEVERDLFQTQRQALDALLARAR